MQDDRYNTLCTCPVLITHLAKTSRPRLSPLRRPQTRAALPRPGARALLVLRRGRPLAPAEPDDEHLLREDLAEAEHDAVDEGQADVHREARDEREDARARGQGRVEDRLRRRGRLAARLGRVLVAVGVGMSVGVVVRMRRERVRRGGGGRVRVRGEGERGVGRRERVRVGGEDVLPLVLRLGCVGRRGEARARVRVRAGQDGLLARGRTRGAAVRSW